MSPRIGANRASLSVAHKSASSKPILAHTGSQRMAHSAAHLGNCLTARACRNSPPAREVYRAVCPKADFLVITKQPSLVHVEEITAKEVSNHVKPQPASVGSGRPRVSACSLLYYLTCPGRLVPYTNPAKTILHRRVPALGFVVRQNASAYAVSRKAFCWRLLTRRGFRLPCRFGVDRPRPSTETCGGKFKLPFECAVKRGFGLIANFRCDLCH